MVTRFYGIWRESRQDWWRNGEGRLLWWPSREEALEAAMVERLDDRDSGHACQEIWREVTIRDAIGDLRLSELVRYGVWVLDMLGASGHWLTNGATGLVFETTDVSLARANALGENREAKIIGPDGHPRDIPETQEV